MPVPQIFKESFHQARQVETYIKLWTENDNFKGRPLESLFYPAGAKSPFLQVGDVSATA